MTILRVSSTDLVFIFVTGYGVGTRQQVFYITPSQWLLRHTINIWTVVKFFRCVVLTLDP